MRYWGRQQLPRERFSTRPIFSRFGYDTENVCFRPFKADAVGLSKGAKMLKCSAYIATSVDGYIATHDGGVKWLENAGNPESGDREPPGDAGFAAYMASVDCMIMGRKCMEMIASFDLTPELL